MLKALIKKQFIEIFRNYFVNQKTGKPRSKGNTIFLFILFASLFVVLYAAFFGMGTGLAVTLIPAGYTWLFFAIMGISSVLLGTFGSVFNTYNALYKSKDNDFLLSMPIPPGKILLSRMITVYFLAFLYGGIVWIPSIVCYLVFASFNLVALILQVILAFIIPLLVTALTCALGWLIAVISSKIKSKSVVTAIVSVIFIGLYYIFCFRFNDFITGLAEIAGELSEGIKIWGNIFYQLGLGATGDPIAFLIFTFVVFLIAAICYYIMSRSFIKIATTKPVEKKTIYVEKIAKTRKVGRVLLFKEWKRFTGCAIYLMNCGLGAVFMIALPVVLLIKVGDLNVLFSTFDVDISIIKSVLPLGLAAIFSLISGMDMVSTPSFSLEGKNLWILKSLPISAKEVIKAKENLHILVNALPMIAGLVASGIILKLEADVIALSLALTFIKIVLDANIGLIIGLSKINLHWTSEVTVVKQGTSILYSMLANFGTSAITFLPFIPLFFVISGRLYLTIMVVVLAIVTMIVRKSVAKKGEKLYNEL